MSCDGSEERGNSWGCLTFIVVIIVICAWLYNGAQRELNDEAGFTQTWQKYDKLIPIGMTYEAVRGILGNEGKEVWRQEGTWKNGKWSPDHIYVDWDDKDIKIDFSEGKVYMKMPCKRLSKK